MKNKAILMMFEIVIMIFVFFFIAAACLKIFASSENISKESTVRDTAVMLAQNCAEILKADKGDIGAVNEYLSDAVNNKGYSVEIAKDDDAGDLLGKANVVVKYENKEVFAITVCWQEVALNE